jgi:hypothetical protein
VQAVLAAFQGAQGQCRLTKSGANIALSPVRGNLLTVNGVNVTVPSGGVTLAPSGLTPGTSYYIYATASGGVVNALVASTTAHATDATTGVEVMSGDSTKTLVGQVRPIAGPAFADSLYPALRPLLVQPAEAAAGRIVLDHPHHGVDDVRGGEQRNQNRVPDLGGRKRRVHFQRFHLPLRRRLHGYRNCVRRCHDAELQQRELWHQRLGRAVVMQCAAVRGLSLRLGQRKRSGPAAPARCSSPLWAPRRCRG